MCVLRVVLLGKNSKSHPRPFSDGYRNSRRQIPQKNISDLRLGYTLEEDVLILSVGPTFIEFPRYIWSQYDTGLQDSGERGDP